MLPLPHYYHVKSHTSSSNYLKLQSQHLPDLNVAPPFEFDGPGDQWSAETLLISALTSSYLRSFKALAKNATLNWIDIDCLSKGILDRTENTTQFVKIKHIILLKINNDTSEKEALSLLKKADEMCFISQSLKCKIELDCNIAVV